MVGLGLPTGAAGSHFDATKRHAWLVYTAAFARTYPGTKVTILIVLHHPSKPDSFGCVIH